MYLIIVTIIICKINCHGPWKSCKNSPLKPSNLSFSLMERNDFDAKNQVYSLSVFYSLQLSSGIFRLYFCIKCQYCRNY